MMTEVRVEKESKPPRGGGWLVAVGVAVLVLAGSFVSVRLGRSVGERIAPQEEVAAVDGAPVVFIIEPGWPARTIGEELTRKGVLQSSFDFEQEVRVQGLSADLKAGTYELAEGMTAEEVLAILVEGAGASEVYTVLIREGRRIDQLLEDLAAQTENTVREFEQALTSGSVVSPFMEGEGATVQEWEGLLFPDTYEFFVDDNPAQILQRLADTTVLRAESVPGWEDLTERLGVSPYEALVVASLIEAEAKLDEDRPLISSVIFNRLGINMGLNIDATVLYAKALTGDEDRTITESDLAIESPYNTYTNSGLPPTPIGAPRLASLAAAAGPAETGYFFYVLVEPGGKHGFCEDLECHNALVAQARADGVIP